ncbi:DNA topoisomerase I [PVC group bacterium (ex Bugula neritina AB1)]|nr:DNA topoisomerase I [PVC group bacterium (ex Bugula neritina AB1)]
MSKSLVIVESPAKMKTIHKFLGSSFTVKASMGHVIDLPKNKIGIDLDKDFSLEYVVIRGKNKILTDLIAESLKVDEIYLAMDPDREGEAIAWHLSNKISKKFAGKIHRVSFNEITKKAVLDAVKNPGQLNQNLVNAQQARRSLDRIVGYKVSPFLWKSVGRGLSAGRVQSVCVRLICEREEQIKAFVPVESWTIEADFQKKDHPEIFHAQLEKVTLSNEKEAFSVLEKVEKASYEVKNIKLTEKKRFPDAPFITSTLQQRAANKIGFSASKTMSVAQKLYEGIDIGNDTVGLITYMRTDSHRISDLAQSEAREYIKKEYGDKFLPSKAPVYKSKSKKKKSSQPKVEAQDAHEAIRPTSLERTPASLKNMLNKDQYSLYLLIWAQFLKSQMTAAIFDSTVVKISADEYIFHASGSIIKFHGHMIVDKEIKELKGGDSEKASSEQAALLPPLAIGEELLKKEMEAKQHFTKPPARFSEASLVKALEDYGIGRPSTYASTIKTIQDRGYVDKIERRFHPSKLGVRVNGVLLQFMPDLFNVDFTANMEEQLDAIAEGEEEWVLLLKNFYEPFEENLKVAQEKMADIKQQVVETDEVCDKCQKKMCIKWGKYGEFLVCSGYPDCRNTRDLEENEDDSFKESLGEPPTCEDCKIEMLLKMGRYGKFWACSNYPKCKKTQTITIKSGVKCPEETCEGELIQKSSRKRGRTFWGCSNYPDCKFLTNKLPQ